MMRDTGPARTVVSSDTGEAAPHEYVTMARTLLGQLKHRMRAGGLAQLKRTVLLPDGTTISASSIHGQDTMRIDRPNVPPQVFGTPQPGQPDIPQPPAGPEVKRPTIDVCQLGPSREVYSSAITTAAQGFAAAAMNTAKDAIYLIAGLPDWLTYSNHTGVASASQLYRLDGDLSTVGTSACEYPQAANSNGSVMVHYDRKADRFFAPVYTPSNFQPVAHLPDGVVYDYAAVWDRNADKSLISQVVGTWTDVWGTEWAYMNALISEGTSEGAVVAEGLFAPGNDASLENQVFGGGYFQIVEPSTWTKKADLRDTDGAGVGGRWYSLFACATPEGNFVVGVQQDGNPPNVFTVSAGGGVVTDWGTPPCAMVLAARMRRRDREVWISADTGVYRNSGHGWEAIPHIPAPPPIDFGVVQRMLLLAYDSTSDAMAAIMPDGSGVWVYGGFDCMDVPLAPFFVRFKHTPAFDYILCTQFEQGTLLVTYLLGTDENYATMTVGRYDIGQLNQTKVTQYQ